MAYLILAALILCGGSLIFVAHFFEMGWWAEVVADFGIAFLISGALGITVEQFTKRKFVRELAENVFRATIGYTLPPSLQEEMRWISSQKLICEDHQQRVTINRIDGETVRFTCDIVRCLRNVTNTDVEDEIGLGTDEWFGPEPSKILKFGYQIEEGQRVELEGDQFAKTKLEKGRPTLSVQPQRVKLPRGEKLTYWATFTEIKSINSDHNSHFSYATENPRVWIEASEGIDFVAAFPRETVANKDKFSRGHYVFRGLVLPGQEIRIRWWEAEKLEKWLSPSSHASE